MRLPWRRRRTRRGIGLWQIIAPRFVRYRDANTYDPVANVAAAINYIRSVYGDHLHDPEHPDAACATPPERETSD